MAIPVNGSTRLIPAYYSFYRPRKDERLSWPSWLTCSGWLTHIGGHHQLQVERRTGKVRRPETDVLPLCHATNPMRWASTKIEYESPLYHNDAHDRAIHLTQALSPIDQRDGIVL